MASAGAHVTSLASSLTDCSHVRSLQDPRTTEIICSDCGVVLQPPEFVSIEMDRIDDNGRPERHHELSLPHRMGTLIPVAAKTRNMRRHQRRSNREAMGGRKDKWYRELHRVARRMEVPKAVFDAAEHSLGDLVDGGHTKGHSMEVVTSALVWLFRKELGCPQPMNEFRKKTGIPRKQFNHAVILCKRRLKIGLLPASPLNYLERMRAETNSKAMKLARSMLSIWIGDSSPGHTVTSGVLASAALYMAGRAIAFPSANYPSQKAIAEKFSCTEVSLRTGMSAMLDSEHVQSLLKAEGFEPSRIFD